MNQQQLAEAEKNRIEVEKQSAGFLSGKIGQFIIWTIIVILGISYCSDKLKSSSVPEKEIQLTKEKTMNRKNAPEGANGIAR
ncbi:hypothetical protein [Delftia sp. GW456-R20]|uniref:hypothetical protein n=1 Tax=Delftia sp. GW456-R20 TaxID=1827145 RepID=UPI0012E799AC|nr:hypothetical protein [Delftia sp. GW456-R20]